MSLGHNNQPKIERTDRMFSLDRVLAFEHVVQSTVSFPVSSASTDIRVYNGTAKLIQ